MEGKKKLPEKDRDTNYPIDIEARLTSLGLYSELERTKNSIEIMRCIYQMLNTAYSLGKDKKFLDPDMVARIQGLVTICGGDENVPKIVSNLILRIYKAYVQGRPRCRKEG